MDVLVGNLSLVGSTLPVKCNNARYVALGPAGYTLTVMSGLERFGSDDQFDQLREAVRQHNSARIKEVLAALEPSVLGLMGPINPAHVRVYLEALKQLGQLWRVFDRPAEKVEEDDVQARIEVEAAERQAAVLAELVKLREIADRRRG